MSTKLEESVLRKLVGMFSPSEGDFLNHKEEEVICGPNDRSLIGFNTYFPKESLMEDYGFTAREADWLINAVRTASRPQSV